MKTNRIQDLITFLYLKLDWNLCFVISTGMFFCKSLLFGIKTNGIVKCWGTVHLMRSPKSEISIGKNVSIISDSKRCSSTSIYAPTKINTWTPSSKIVIGDGVSLNGTAIVARTKGIYIGERTMIGPNVVIVDSHFHSIWPPELRNTNFGAETDEDVFIGRNVWIATQIIILKGVRIGDNSIIAAGSVVTGNIPENVLAGGIPAKVIKKLG